MGDVSTGNDRHCKDAATELIENAAQAAGDKLDKLVTNIFDTIGNTANDKIKDLEGTVNNYIEQTKIV